MASVKQYAYYVKGNKVAIVERDTQFDNDVNSKDYGPGTDRASWKSPLSEVTDGLEIQYVHSPEYWLPAQLNIGFDISTAQDAQHSAYYFPVYGELSGYFTLWFPTYQEGGRANLTANVLFSADDTILIQGHPMWNGLHKVKSSAATGYIQTYTKWNSGLKRIEEDPQGNRVVFAAATTGVPPNISIANDVDFVKHVTPGEYYFNPSDMADAGNEGLFKADSVSEDGDTLLFEDSEYIIDVTTEGELKKVANNFVDATHSGSPVLYMTQVLLCPGAYVVKGVNTLDDEEDNIDLSNYLSKALVYYVKAKTAEDMMNIEAKEYFMKEFRKMVEKHNNTRVAGVRMQAAGPYAIK